jgi:hypothetical protein
VTIDLKLTDQPQDVRPLNAAPFNIKAELEKAIKTSHGLAQQVDLMRLYIEAYGASLHR